LYNIEDKEGLGLELAAAKETHGNYIEEQTKSHHDHDGCDSAANDR